MSKKVFSRKYEVQEVLARGGMGEVYKAWDNKLKDVVAIKVVHTHLSSDTAFLERFRDEARKTAKLRGHENIVQIFSVENDQETEYLVMEYFPSTNLRDYLRETGNMPVHEAVNVVRQITNALSYTHSRGMIHRDIKPANILLNKTKKVKLTDFGIAKALDQVPLTSTGQLIGTVKYMSPEQARDAILDRRTDLYSLGMVFYELLTGENLWGNTGTNAILVKLQAEETIPSLTFPSEVPQEIQTVVVDLLKYETAERIQSAEELTARLEALRPIWSQSRAETPAADADGTIVKPMDLEPDVPADDKTAAYLHSPSNRRSSPTRPKKEKSPSQAAEAQAAEEARVAKAKADAEAEKERQRQAVEAQAAEEARVAKAKADAEAEKERQRQAVEAQAAEEARVAKAKAEAEAEKERQRQAVEAQAAEEARVAKVKAEAEAEKERQRQAAEAQAAEEARVAKAKAEAEAEKERQRQAAEAQAAEEARVAKAKADAEAEKERQRQAAEAQAAEEARVAKAKADAEAEKERQRQAAEASSDLGTQEWQRLREEAETAEISHPAQEIAKREGRTSEKNEVQKQTDVIVETPKTPPPTRQYQYVALAAGVCLLMGIGIYFIPPSSERSNTEGEKSEELLITPETKSIVNAQPVKDKDVETKEADETRLAQPKADEKAKEEQRLAKLKAEQEAKAKEDARLAQLKADEKAKEEQRLAKLKAEQRLAKLKAEQEAKAKEDARLAQLKADEKAKEEQRLAKLKAEQEAKAKEDARLAQLKADEKAKEEQRLAKLKAEQEAKAKEDARLAQLKADEKAKEEQRLAKLKAEQEAKAKEEQRLANLKAEQEKEIAAASALETETLLKLLEEVQVSVSERDLLTLKRRTTMTDDRQRMLRTLFANYQKIETSVGNIEKSSNKAVVILQITKLIRPNGKSIKPSPLLQKIKVEVQKDENGWGQILW